ncbi:MAG: gas vesicle protein GvpN [Thermoguttaceae bacterium]|jgi:gas vesicle protein GvpN
MIGQGNGHSRLAGHKSAAEDHTTVRPVPGEAFVRTPQVQQLAERALAFLEAGYPVNLSGPAGTGKTTMALHLAAQLDQPVTLIHGDDEFGSSDLVGNDKGYQKSKLVDNFIHSVMKTEETMRSLWVDSRLTTACRNGHTLIYDEFTRSRPEANNVLLSILGEGLMDLPKLRRAGEGYLKVHPDFRAIFTSNPQEYAGVHTSQDALMDRLVTIHMDHYDRETEVAITAAKSNISIEDAEWIVDIVRNFRRRKIGGHRPSIRAAITIARVMAYRHAACNPDDLLFQCICCDVLGLNGARGYGADENPLSPDDVRAAIQEACELAQAEVVNSG